MVTMLKNKCSVWKRIKFPTFWYNCYYFTWSDTYFIQLETLLINHPSYVSFAGETRGKETTWKIPGRSDVLSTTSPNWSLQVRPFVHDINAYCIFHHSQSRVLWTTPDTSRWTSSSVTWVTASNKSHGVVKVRTSLATLYITWGR